MRKRNRKGKREKKKGGSLEGEEDTESKRKRKRGTKREIDLENYQDRESMEGIRIKKQNPKRN